jgi:hypothetical protein
MKKLLFVVCIFVLNLWASVAEAQYIPKSLSYQAVARDNEGLPIVDEEIVVEISIIAQAADGEIEWQEVHYPVTNTFGLFAITIGKGTSTYKGTKSKFADIIWTSGPHYVKVRVDFGKAAFLNGFLDMGTMELLSVPYALVADTALKAPRPKLNDLPDVNTTGLLTGQILRWNGTSWTPGYALEVDNFLKKDGSVDLTADWTIKTNTVNLTNGNLNLTNGTVTSANMVTNDIKIGGKSIRTISIDPLLVTTNDETFASSKALKTYIDAKTSATSDWVSNGTSLYNISKKVGIGIIPEDKFHVEVGINGFLVSGNYSSSANVPNRSTGTRMCFYPGKSAFRAGTIESQATYWNDANVGDFSQAFGKDTKASGDYSCVFGLLNQANGAKTFVAGKSNIVNGEYAVAFGLDNTVTGELGFAFGRGNNVQGANAFAIGFQNLAYGANSLSVGSTNNPQGTNSAAIGTANLGTGEASLTGGTLSNAKGLYSIAWGYKNSTDANAEGSACFGKNSRARGAYSFVTGEGNISTSYLETIMGRFAAIESGIPNNISTWDAADHLLVLGNGKDIGTTSNAFIVYKNGDTKINGNLTVSGTVTQASDSRLKKDIADLPPMYANLLQLRPVTYFWKATYQAGRTFNTDKQFGLIAQEVEQLFPDFVQTDKDGYKSVNYMALIPVMIQAIKAQQNQIENLKEANKTSGIELTQIQSQQASLENRLEAIEKILTAQQSK